MNAKSKKFLGWAVLGAIVVIVSACSCPPLAVQETTPTTPGGTPTEPAPTAEPTPTVEPTQPPRPLIDLPGVEEITLTTPQEDAGVKPQFTWQPLEGAARYILVLYTVDLQPYWAWSGAAASVYLGGSDTAPRDDSAGPVLSAGMSWAVMAFDSDDRLIGSSVLRSISPSD
jgi:hypothetical protein